MPIITERRDFEWRDLVKMQNSVDDLAVMIAHLDLVLSRQLQTNHPSYGAFIRQFQGLTFLMNHNLIICQKEIYEVITEALLRTKGTEQ